MFFFFVQAVFEIYKVGITQKHWQHYLPTSFITRAFGDFLMSDNYKNCEHKALELLKGAMNNEENEFDFFAQPHRNAVRVNSKIGDSSDFTDALKQEHFGQWKLYINGSNFQDDTMPDIVILTNIFLLIKISSEVLFVSHGVNVEYFHSKKLKN